MWDLIFLASQAAAATPSQCEALTAKSVALKAEMRRIVGDRAPATAHRQATEQGALGATAVAGQVVAQAVGLPGHFISEAAIQGQDALAANAMRDVQGMAKAAGQISRDIVQVERERKAACGGDARR